MAFPTSDLSQENVLRDVHDPVTQTLRTTATVGTVTVELDYNDDSVEIGDSSTGNTLNINANGSIDANVEIDAADGDNIAIIDTDGDQLNINPDGSINTEFNYPTTPVITNIAIPLANTEQSYALPADTKRFIVRVRGNAKIQVAYAALQSGTNFLTIAPGNVYEETDVKVNLTIYFQSNKASETLEVLSWS